MRDPRRYFRKHEVWRAWELQGRVCNLCKRKIPGDLMVGDHIVPWILGGPTHPGNLQALCPSCNLRKGSEPQTVAQARFEVDRLAPAESPMRRWQAEAMPVILSSILGEPVLIEACPGAGKTRLGLEVAYRLVTEGEISRVLVVVPTLAIADGWQRTASSSSRSTPTLPLHTQRDWRPVDPVGDEWLGAIITYQSLFSSTEMYLAHATDPGQRTLVIFDEVHHAGAEGAWGASAQAAFAAGATAILSMTGTAFRTDQTPIVFVPSLGGQAKPHYTYSYEDAICDGACRPVQFVEVQGETTFRTEDGAVHTVSFQDTDLTGLGEQRRLLAALESFNEGSIAGMLLADANRYILELRKQGDLDAGGLVVCIDCDHADAVARHMNDHVLGWRPLVACSRLLDPNDPDPANTLLKFRTGHDPWIVAVNMVSEGVDIPRLRVVVYLSNRLTLLAFRQIVGRVVRTDPANANDCGRVYLPAEPRLAEMAKTVTEEAKLLPPPIIIVTDARPPARARIGGEPGPGRVPFEIIQTVGEQGPVFDTFGREAPPFLVECARRFIARDGLTSTDPESLAMLAAENPELRAELLKMRDES
jgi:superfamily II DNA or RNA helicase